MRYTPLSKALLIACFSILCSCSSSSRVVKTYEDPNFSSGPFANILVVGIHENATSRRRFESTVATALRSDNTAASASLNFMLSTDEISRESLRAIVDSEGFDAVLITRLVDMQMQIESREGRVTADAQRRNDLPLADFFRYDYVEYQDPMEITTVRTVVLATDLYEVASELRIWSAESTATDKTSVFETISDISRALANALSRDGFIR